VFHYDVIVEKKLMDVIFQRQHLLHNIKFILTFLSVIHFRWMIETRAAAFSVLENENASPFLGPGNGNTVSVSRTGTTFE
jgi:hypothetical protein